MLMLLSVHVTSVLFSLFGPDYGLLLELHALTLVTRSYALLTCTQIQEQDTCNSICMNAYQLVYVNNVKFIKASLQVSNTGVTNGVFSGYISPVYTSSLNRFQIGLRQLCKRP